MTLTPEQAALVERYRAAERNEGVHQYPAQTLPCALRDIVPVFFCEAAPHVIADAIGICVQAATLIEAQAAEIAALREALGPFALEAHETPVVDEAGWTENGMSWCRERIVDWFGPSDFRRARAARNITGESE